jgi:hypothetical protein
MTTYVNFTAAMRGISGRSWKRKASTPLLPTCLGKFGGILIAVAYWDAIIHEMQLTEHQFDFASSRGVMTGHKNVSDLQSMYE